MARPSLAKLSCLEVFTVEDRNRLNANFRDLWIPGEGDAAVAWMTVLSNGMNSTRCLAAAQQLAHLVWAKSLPLSDA